MIITGIVLLFAVALVIWLGGQATTRRTSPEAEQQRLRQVAVQPVKDYIQSCLDVVTSTALELLGKQGGVLYQSQGGLTQDVTETPGPRGPGTAYVRYDGLNVSYDLLRPTANIDSLYYAEPSLYPWETFPYIFNDTARTTVRKTQFTGYFGESKLPPLFKPGKESIQEQIESYVNVNLPECTRWSTFATQGLSIAADTPNTSVYIAGNVTQIATEQFFSVLADWQVNVTDLTTGGNTTLNQFSLSYPVHLAKFYLLVQGIVNAEVTDSTFDPHSVSTAATPVTVIDDVFQNPDDKGADDIVVAQDAESQLRGKPLEFRILRKNRLPALQWINQTDLDKYHFCKGAHITLDKNVLTIHQGDPRDWSALLNATDPDEDTVTFHTLPSAPTQADATPPDVFRLYVYANDGGTIEDFQILNIPIKICVA